MKTEFGKKLLKVMSKKIDHDWGCMFNIALELNKAKSSDIDDPYFRGLLDRFAEHEVDREMSQKTVNLMIRIEELLEKK